MTNLLCRLLSAVKNLPRQPIAATGNMPTDIKLPSDRVPHDGTCDVSGHFCNGALQLIQHGLHGCSIGGSSYLETHKNTEKLNGFHLT